MKEVLLVFIAIMCFGLTGCDNDVSILNPGAEITQPGEDIRNNDEEMLNDISLSFLNE